MEKMTPWEVLEQWGISNPTEDDMWDAIAEADGHELDYYADGDISEWL